MSVQLSACIITGEDEPFIDLCIASIGGVVDEIVIVGDPNRRTRECIYSTPFSEKIRLIWRDGERPFRYGRARQLALESARGDWIWQIDTDEVAGDTAYLIKEYIKSNEFDFYTIKYEHFVYDLNHLDATVPEHFSGVRLFKKDGVTYNRDIHELAQSSKWKEKGGIIRDVTVYHLGLVRGLQYVIERKKLNLEHPDRSHSPEWCQWWSQALLLGNYPTKKRDFPLPTILERLII